MDSFKIWIISLCGATAVSAIFKLLLSDSSLKKVINVFFSIFVLFYTVMPIQAFFNDKIDFEVGNEIDFKEYYQDGYETIVKKAIINLCNDIDVIVLSININSYIDDEGYLNINDIVIQTNSQNPNEIEEIIKNELGFEVEIK